MKLDLSLLFYTVYPMLPLPSICYYGMLVGGGIFLAITLLGGLFYGKEAMGFGDVKLMGALGLYFGLSNIIIITLVSFLIGAILSIVLLATKIKKSDEYIPFRTIYCDCYHD